MTSIAFSPKFNTILVPNTIFVPNDVKCVIFCQRFQMQFILVLEGSQKSCYCFAKLEKNCKKYVKNGRSCWLIIKFLCKCSYQTHKIT